MKLWHGIYQSMTATYDLGTVLAETEEQALRLIRGRATAFSRSEQQLIKVTEAE